MKKSKLIQYLSSCTGHELRRFRLFLISPYFNVNPAPIALFDHLRPYFPDFTAPELSSETVFETLFPGKAYDDKQLKYLMSALSQLMEEFWTVQGMRELPGAQDQALLEGLLDRKLDKYFLQKLRSARQKLHEKPLRDADFHQHRYLLETASHSYTITRRNRDPESSLQELLDALDASYMVLKLRYSAAAMARQEVLGVTSRLTLLEEVLAHLYRHPPETDPALLVYQHIIFTFDPEKEQEAFPALLRLLEAHATAFSNAERAEMYAFALNYCIRRFNLGDHAFLPQLYALYLLLMEQELLIEDGELPPQHFKNIVTLGLRLKHDQQVADIIGQFSRFLPENLQENSIRYSSAALAFARKEYGNALRTLQVVEFTDVYYHLDAKVLLLKTYYELEETEALFSLIDSFRTYLYRNRKISDYQRTVYRNLVKYTKQLLRHRLGGRKPLQQISQEIEACGQIADRAWLEEKVTEMVAG